MDYSSILQELKSASLFDLYRLLVAVDQQLDNPERIEQVRARLHPGMKIRFFETSQNGLVDATVLELNRTRLVVQNHQDGRRWSIRYCSVNVDEVETDLSPMGEGKLDRSQLKGGDRVGFRDRQNQIRYGRIVSLNQKTATVLVNDRDRWRVAYSYLFLVIEGAAVKTGWVDQGEERQRR